MTVLSLWGTDTEPGGQQQRGLWEARGYPHLSSLGVVKEGFLEEGKSELRMKRGVREGGEGIVEAKSRE